MTENLELPNAEAVALYQEAEKILEDLRVRFGKIPHILDGKGQEVTPIFLNAQVGKVTVNTKEGLGAEVGCYACIRMDQKIHGIVAMLKDSGIPLQVILMELMGADHGSEK